MDSVLNPEAPEFQPRMTKITQDAYLKVNKLIMASNHLPSGKSFESFTTFTDFNVVTCQLSKNIVEQSNQIMTSELSTVMLKLDDDEYNTDKIIDSNDSMLDRVNISIDTMSGVHKPSDQFLDSMKSGNVSSWNITPVVSKIKMGSATLIGAKNILRPQLKFKDKIDNSESLWVPKIFDKPNNIKPLAITLVFNENDEAIGYEHPYKVELSAYHPPAEFINEDSDAVLFPPPLEDTNLIYIDTEEQVDRLVEHLTSVTEFAIDVEHHSYRTYQGITCLIQITTNEGGDFIIDALAVREHLHKLNLAFTDPKKLKVLHGAKMDVLWLQRDFGVYIVGMFDTYVAAKALDMSMLSLKYLLNVYCKVDVDKKYQLADWRIRPLPAELIKYARQDTHYLLYVWRRMKRDILLRGQGKPDLLLSVFEQSQGICGLTYSKPVVDDNSHLNLYVNSRKTFNSQQMAALKMLYKWRDTEARDLDESVTYLLPNHMLLALAETLPREVQGVNACCNPMPPFVKQNILKIHKMLLTCREMPLEPQLYQMPPSISNMVNATRPAIANNIHDLSYIPDYGDEGRLLDSASILENLKEVEPDVKSFTNSFKIGNALNLNTDVKLFLPPYIRYNKYRILAQMQEITEFNAKKANKEKMEAIKTDNKLSLVPERNTQEILDPESNTQESLVPKSNTQEIQSQKQNEAVQIKRKKTPDNVEHKESISMRKKDKNINQCYKNVKQLYTKVNYKKFYDDQLRDGQPKKKYKRH